MTKHIYLVRGERKEPYQEFRQRIFDLVDKSAGKQGITDLWLTITEEAPPKISVIPFKKNKIAAISMVGNDGTTQDHIIDEKGFSGAYAVTTAQPVRYEKDWEDRTPTPGICLLTLFSQRKDIDRATFLDRWHNSHTPLSLRLHPLWHYDRNVIEEKIHEGSDEWHGIVEEHFRTRRDLLNPVRFFGDHPLKMFYHMMEVYTDTRSFLDYKTIEPYLVKEYKILTS